MEDSEIIAHEKGKRSVAGGGPRDANIVIVGEAPGVNEDQEGIPFCGRSGLVLRNMLSEAGIEYEDCYVTNIVKKRPPGNDFGIYYKDKMRKEPTVTLQDWYEILYKEIRTVAPNLVIALGGEALRALTGHRSITKHRGSIYWSDLTDCKVIGTYHPAYIVRGFKDRPIGVTDFKRCAVQGEFRHIKKSCREILTYPNYAQVHEFLGRIINNEETIAFDIETETNQVNAISFAYHCDDIYVSICIPFWFGNEGSYWTFVSMPYFQRRNFISKVPL